MLCPYPLLSAFVLCPLRPYCLFALLFRSSFFFLSSSLFALHFFALFTIAIFAHFTCFARFALLAFFFLFSSSLPSSNILHPSSLFSSFIHFLFPYFFPLPSSFFLLPSSFFSWSSSLGLHRSAFIARPSSFFPLPSSFFALLLAFVTRPSYFFPLPSSFFLLCSSLGLLLSAFLLLPSSFFLLPSLLFSWPSSLGLHRSAFFLLPSFFFNYTPLFHPHKHPLILLFSVISSLHKLPLQIPPSNQKIGRSLIFAAYTFCPPFLFITMVVHKAIKSRRSHKKKRSDVRQNIASDQLWEDQTTSQLCEYPENAAELCQDIFGYTPKPEQQIVVEHIGRGEDCILIAGCGWGKTLTYFLPLALWKHCIIVIISPLIALMEEQHRKLQVVGITSICIHSDADLPNNLEARLSK